MYFQDKMVARWISLWLKLGSKKGDNLPNVKYIILRRGFLEQPLNAETELALDEKDNDLVY